MKRVNLSFSGILFALKTGKKWFYNFIFVQKCIPWKCYIFYCTLRNYIFDINTQRTYDELWSQERSAPRYDRFYPIAFNKLVQMIPRNSKVIDIGCGLGILMARLRTEKACEVLGIDISKEAISALYEKGMRGVVAHVPPIPICSDSADIVIATEVLEHVRSPKVFLKEMLRILKPNGTIFITVPEAALGPNTERYHIWKFSENSIFKLFKGLKDVSTIEIVKVKEENENFCRLIARGKKCQK